jgi:hypothetical protein
VRWCSSPGDEGLAALLTLLRVKEEEVGVCRLCAISRPSAGVGAHSWNALHRRAATTTQRGRGGARAEGSRSGGGAHKSARLAEVASPHLSSGEPRRGGAE